MLRISNHTACHFTKKCCFSAKFGRATLSAALWFAIFKGKTL